MEAPALLLSLVLVSVLSGPAATLAPVEDSESHSERGKVELRRVRSLAAQPRYGECWARALQHLDTRCRDMTSETQGQIALSFTHCHLSSSGRDFPPCPEGSRVSRCTAGMDSVAFHAYTEFFTHTHSICHFLQSEAWRSQAESTMDRLTETSAGVAQQLQSTSQLAVELMEAQSAALQTQQELLDNGEQLRVTLKDSTQGLRAVFSELSSVSREQQVALAEIFNRVAFLQSFLLMEAHSVSSSLYHAAALAVAFLITSTPRSSRARSHPHVYEPGLTTVDQMLKSIEAWLVLLAQVCMNFYLERKIYQYVMSLDQPEHRNLELLSVYVSLLRRAMVCAGVCVLAAVCFRYRDPLQQSLQVLQQLRETQHSLQEALQHADSLRRQQTMELKHLHKRLSRTEDQLKKPPSTAEESLCGVTSDPSPDRKPHNSSSSPLVYSILVEDKQPRRYSLRSRRSEKF